MNPSKFDEIVKNRANERVQQRIAKFKQDIINAVSNLTGVSHYESTVFGWDPKDINPYLKCITTPRSDPKWSKWPAELWRNEEKRVQDELLQVMDEMAKALVSKPATEGQEKPEQ